MAYSLFLNPKLQTPNFKPRSAPNVHNPPFALVPSLAAETRREGSCEKIILPFIILRTNSPLKATRIFGPFPGK
jgi:hypothetical protein